MRGEAEPRAAEVRPPAGVTFFWLERFFSLRRPFVVVQFVRPGLLEAR